jgi:hypothetical protein
MEYPSLVTARLSGGRRAGTSSLDRSEVSAKLFLRLG